MLQFLYQKSIPLILWVVVGSAFVVEVKTARNRTGKQFDLFEEYNSLLSPSSSQFQYYKPPSGNSGSSGSSQGYYAPLLPSGPNSYSKSHSGPQSSYINGRQSEFSSGYFPNNDFSEFFSSSGYSPGLSQSYLPEYLQNSQPLSPLSSSGYKPGKPPVNSFGSYYPHYGSIAAAAAGASASGGGGGSGSTAAASASTSSGYPFGWGWKPSTSPPVTEESLGWAPPLPEYPPKPVPEFTYQFSLKPSAFGWETSYNVPCGSYKIQPRVIAHLRLATQAVLPKAASPDGDKRRKRSTNDLNYLPNFSNGAFDPFQLARSHHYSPYQNEQFPAPKPTFRPRTCRWNFSAVDGCKLNFKCTWFQLPALFRCDENYLHVSDETILLNSKFCGNRRPRRIYSSSTGKLTLTFKSEGAALPAIFDCTVLCTPDESLADGAPQTSPAPTTSSGELVTSPSSLPIVVHHDSSSTSLHQDGSLVVSTNNRNSTIIINLPPKQQPRMGNCKCGVPDNSHYSSNVVESRVVGGSSMKPGESPWTAALVKKNSNRPYCGAALINNKFLLTAAHCVLNQTRKTRESDLSSASGNKTVEHVYFDVLLNEHDISQANEIAGGTIRAKVDKIIIHPKYDNTTFHFDAALIRLAKSVDINPPEPASKRYHRYYFNPFDFHSLRKKRFIMPEIEARAIPPKPVPICLPDSSNLRNGKKLLEDYAVVTGWGLVTEGGIPSNEMLKARVEIFNDTTCRNLYKKHNYVITKSMMCAGHIHGSIDSCVGDSGSPLATEDKNRFVLAGVVSWGRGCGRREFPGVYTKVTELMDWIYAEASDDAVWCS